MITDRQVRQLRKLLVAGETLSRAAWKTGMDRKTARKYRDGKLPSERATEHTWRTREDPFDEVWEEVYEQLDENHGLQAKTLFEWLQRKYPGRFDDGQLRTFQRGVKRWRATQGPQKEVFFSQVHSPGRLCASDFTSMNDLGVTIQKARFDHLLYHFVLTYSNWQWATICFSESFESLSEGLQEALWQLGGVPERHRSDRLSAAVNNLSDRREFTARYRSLMDYYRLTAEKTNPESGHENGDVESAHRHFKEAVDQALMLRGSRDFESREDYAAFLRELLTQRNAGRSKRLHEERSELSPLPPRRLESFIRAGVQVNRGSLIRVQKNVYSVYSRLIGEHVDVRVYADRLEVWYGQRRVDTLPRLRGSKKHYINYRHVIDWLVRKPGAFDNYRYRDDLFPTSRFRMAYDTLCERHASNVASREYLAILEMAARTNESAVDDALRFLITNNKEVNQEEVRRLVEQEEAIPAATDVVVDEPDLNSFDWLLDISMVASKDVKRTLVGHLRELHLPTFRECFEAAAGRAVQETLSYEQYLLELAQRECEVRRLNRIARLLRQSKLPLEKSLDHFDLKRLPAKVSRQVHSLSDGGFVDRAENLLAFGKSGSGKTHLLCGIAQELVRQGRKVYFSTCSLLVQDLLVAKRDLKLSRVLKRLSGFDALLIDDIGYVQQSREEMEVLFTLLAERYERGTVMITSNLAFSKWEAIFKDPMTTAAAIDRLVHHSVILELNVPSYRLEQAKKSKTTKTSALEIPDREQG